jgi:basic membrane protein A and related proteins
MRKSILQATLLLMVLAMAVSACAPAATPTAAPAATQAPAATSAPAATQATAATAVPAAATAAPISIPDIQQGKFNVAVVLIGPATDGGWSQAHAEGSKSMMTADPTINVAVLENINPGTDAENAMRALARKGYDLIIGTTFEYGPTMAALAQEFPKTNWLHESGWLSNNTNFGNLFGSMEDMKYLAGMVAGARAKADGSTKLGYIAPWPFAEVVRLGDAFMLGAKVTCPECTMEVRWIFDWYNPDKEKQAAQSLLDSGVDVILAGSDTPSPLVAAAGAGKWALTYDLLGSCSPSPKNCLGTEYWNWGPIELNIVKQIRAGTWKAGNAWLEADSGLLGFYGFMPGQTPQPGVPDSVKPMVQAKIADMVAGKFTVQDIFRGPIRDNTGKIMIPAGKTVTVEDLFGIDAPSIKSMNLTGRTACTFCMPWLVDGIQGTIPPMPNP